MSCPVLSIEDRFRREEALRGYFGGGATQLQLNSGGVLRGLEPDLSPVDVRFAEPAVAPLVLVSYEPHDPLYGLAASVEESSFSESRIQSISDLGVESGQRSLSLGPWVEAVATRLAELLALPSDWDGHGASSIAPANIRAAGRFLATVMAPSTPAPTIVPTSAGGLQLEWHRAGFDVELLFGEEEPPLLYIAQIDSGKEWEGLPVEGFAEFDLAQRLGG